MAFPVPRSTNSEDDVRYKVYKREEVSTLQEQRQEGNEKDQKDWCNAAFDPVKDRDQIVATRLTSNDISLSINSANGQLLIQSANIEYWKEYEDHQMMKKWTRTSNHEHLNGVNNQNVVDMEAWVTIIES